jgi:1-acyl-sn-glycerol-3-phosphate acyltransferase
MPPTLIRRLLLVPLVVVIGCALAALTPPVALLSWAFGLLRRRDRAGRVHHSRLLRMIILGLVWAAGETAALTVFLGLWIVSGFGGRLDTEPYQARQYAVVTWFLNLVYRVALRACALTVTVAGPDGEGGQGSAGQGNMGAGNMGAGNTGAGNTGQRSAGQETSDPAVGAQSPEAQTAGARSPGTQAVGARSPRAQTSGAQSVGAESSGAPSLEPESPGAESPAAPSVGARSPRAQSPGAPQTAGAQREARSPYDPAAGEPADRPVIVLSRHAGPADSLLLIHYLLSVCHRRPRVVLKATLQLDPTVDIMANRLPNALLHRSPNTGVNGTRQRTEQIRRLAAGMSGGSALVIFPEGGNWTPQRWRRGIERLRRRGRPDLAARAAAMPNLLPPHGSGALTAIAACPAADVVFVAHTGLDRLVSVRDVWRSLHSDLHVSARWWLVPAASVPRTAGPEGQLGWLYDWWERIDAWITAENQAVPDPRPPADLPAGT